MLVVAAGTEWLTVLVEVVPDIVAVIVFVDGITAAVGTTKSTSNSPSVFGVTEVRLFESYWMVTRKLFGEVTLVAGNPTPLSFTVVPIRLSESLMLIFGRPDLHWRWQLPHRYPWPRIVGWMLKKYWGFLQ